MNSLPLMVSKIQENQLEEVVNRLCQHLSSGKDELRDISSIGTLNFEEEKKKKKGKEVEYLKNLIFFFFSFRIEICYY